ncbi:Nucleoside 2-deoxyribosyltransferase [Enterococcus sp. GMD1E]|nr:Nucleoside 2-deoxyribosyltransferase [Enterococcus sp. GMD1E]
MKIYFAAPMFAKSDLLYNQQLVKEIRELSSELSIYLPQENEAINDKTAYADSRMIALADTEKVLASDLMIALLDGLTIDAGVASEIGVAYAKGIPGSAYILILDSKAEPTRKKSLHYKKQLKINFTT